MKFVSGCRVIPKFCFPLALPLKIVLTYHQQSASRIYHMWDIEGYLTTAAIARLSIDLL